MPTHCIEGVDVCNSPTQIDAMHMRLSFMHSLLYIQLKHVSYGTGVDAECFSQFHELYKTIFAHILAYLYTHGMLASLVLL